MRIRESWEEVVDMGKLAACWITTAVAYGNVLTYMQLRR